MKPRRKIIVLTSITLAALGFAVAALAQPAAVDPATHAQHAQQNPGHTPPSGDADVAAQVQQLAARVAALQAQMQQQMAHQTGGGSMQPMPGMSGGNGQKPMSGGMMMDGMPMGGMSGGKKPMASGMAMDQMEMGPMGGGGSMGSMMDMMSGMGGGNAGGMGMGMDMMGMAPKAIHSTSALPGFPGASHLYHIGATNFFLDHDEHLKLSNEQKAQLGRAREQSSLKQAEFQRKVAQAEQELWTLTASDQPDAEKIQAKISEVEKLRGELRMAFIRSVGEAAKTLTDAQRQQLLGQGTP